MERYRKTKPNHQSFYMPTPNQKSKPRSQRSQQLESRIIRMESRLNHMEWERERIETSAYIAKEKSKSRSNGYLWGLTIGLVYGAVLALTYLKRKGLLRSRGDMYAS